MENNIQNREFLQSLQWREFQETVGRKTHFVENADFSASVVEHELPIVGKYFYIPRGPVLKVKSGKLKVKSFLERLVELAQKNNTGWIRIEPENEEALSIIKEDIAEKIVRAPHDMQPREVFVIDISKSEEQLLAEMKSKTRYNIGVAKKHGVKISCSGGCHSGLDPESREIKGSEINAGIPDQVRDDNERQNRNDKSFFVEEFLRLTKEMAERQGIAPHPEEYYRKMIEALPENMLKIYSAEFEGKIIASSLVIFFGETATYAHGASSNENRNVMAPFLIQWQAILDAKKAGFKVYDFGGVKTNSNDNSWAGITQFKLGFSPNTKPIVFAGTYDIIVNPRKYAVYRGLQRAKALLYKIRR
ncbi:MAG: methicillin resistance protein [uncultured bacterium]|nr:MAG: methicillin resistance protein [uncultured bacterium]